MNELYHHGIKGMHWGIRRFQNPDGTLTAAGKRREQANSDRAARKEATRQRDWNAKNASQLSDKELTDQILRLQREKQLKQLTDDVVRPGRKKTKDLLDRYGNQVLAAAVTAATTVYVTNKINPRKSTYESMRETAEAQKQLAKENYWQKHYDSEGNPR